jgi:DNA-directed RNA polymerase subunit K/omega
MSALGKPTFPSEELVEELSSNENAGGEEDDYFKTKSPEEEYEEEEGDDDDGDDDDDDDDGDDDGDDDDDDDEVEKPELDASDNESVTSDIQAPLVDTDDDDDEDDEYLQKFEKDIQTNILEQFHPETNIHNYEEVKKLSKVTRNENGIVVDPLHRTIPYITKYERTRILGQRASQINSGAKPFVSLKADVIDGYLIAEEELKSKKIPFIIKRPIPGGGFEYWRVADLDLL